LKAGSYDIIYRPAFKSVDVRDYTIIVDAPIKVDIFDKNGKTSTYPSAHDYSSKGLTSLVPN